MRFNRFVALVKSLRVMRCMVYLYCSGLSSFACLEYASLFRLGAILCDIARRYCHTRDSRHSVGTLHGALWAVRITCDTIGENVVVGHVGYCFCNLKCVYIYMYVSRRMD